MRASNRAIKVLCTCIVIVAMRTAMAAAAAAGGGPKVNNLAVFRVPRGERQLFLDDYGIASIENLAREMHQPDKKGAVIRSWKPNQTIQTRTVPVWDPKEKLFKFWVSGTDEPYRVSPDGLHWTARPAPNLPVRWVVYDTSESDPSHRFKAFFRNSDFMGVSPDGVTWTKVNVTPVTSSDESNCSFDEKAHLFIATVKHGGPHGRAVRLSTSRDFEHWTKPELVFHADDLDQKRASQVIDEYMAGPMPELDIELPDENDVDWAWQNVDVYNMGIFRYEGLYIGMPAIYYAKLGLFTKH